MRVSGNSIPGRGNGRCKDPEEAAADDGGWSRLSGGERGDGEARSRAQGRVRARGLVGLRGDRLLL